MRKTIKENKVWCHDCGQDGAGTYCTNDGHRLGVPQGNQCEECSGFPAINKASLRDTCHSCKTQGSTGSRYCNNDGHRLGVSAGSNCEACLGLPPATAWGECFTAPQIKLLLDEGIMDFWKGQQRQPQGIKASIAKAATQKAGTKHSNKLQQAMGGLSPNDPRLANVMMHYGVYASGKPRK